MRYSLLLYLCFTVFSSTNAQDSYVKRLRAFTGTGTPEYFRYLSVNRQTPDLLGALYSDFTYFALGSLDTSGNVLKSVLLTVEIPPGQGIGLGLVYSYIYNDSCHLFTSEANANGTTANPSILRHIIASYNEHTGNYWCKIIRTTDLLNNYTPLTVSDDQKYVLVNRFLGAENYTDTKGLGLSLLDYQTGTGIWHQRFWTEGERQLQSHGLVSKDNNLIFSAAHANFMLEKTLYLTEIDTTGTLIQGVKIIDNQYSWTKRPFITTDSSPLYTDHLGNVYLAGKVKTSDTINNYGEPGTYDMMIVKLDSDLKLVWAKQLSVDNFSVFGFSIAVGSNGEVTYVCSTQGNFPIISGRLDENGNSLYNYGYDFTFFLLEVAPTGHVYMMNIDFDFENFESINVLAKTRPDGTIPSCSYYETCVNISDIDIEIEPATWYTDTLPGLEDMELIIEPGTITSEDYCNPLAYPTPDFVLPDTICQFSCVEPAGLNNQLANYVEWYISGPAMDTLVRDTSFQLCFDVAGSYQIEHRVWVLGCESIQDHTLVVLADDLQPPLQDTTACGFPFAVSLQSSRPLQTALWSTGQTGVSINIDTAGTYSVSATDGYCEVLDTFMVSDLYEQYPLPWLLPLDTTVCEQSLPITIQPQSFYSGVLSLDNQTQSSVLSLSAAGTYELSLQIEQCLQKVPLEVESFDCSAKIYLPNAFSPNSDGRNDTWFPQGQNFEIIEMQIFDRWGGLVFQSTDSQTRWDGSYQKQTATEGVYLAVLRYYNPLLQEDGMVTQEVVLLR